MKQQFIGFGDSDSFLAAVDRNRPINLNVGRKSGTPDKRFGLSIDSTLLTMSQVFNDEALYFQAVTHRYQVAYGRIMDIDEGKPARLAEQVLTLAKKYLDERGFTWRPCLLSMPLNYVTLDGEPTFLTYDKEQGYSYKGIN